jgi:hypothetical protein
MEYILNAILVYLGVGTIIAGMMKVIIERCLCEKDRRVFTREAGPIPMDWIYIAIIFTRPTALWKIIHGQHKS